MTNEPFGIDGEPAPLEYVINFIQQYLHLRRASNKLSTKLNEKDIGHLTKSAWLAFNTQMCPEEYISVIAKAHKNMPNGKRFILPHQLSSYFSKNIAEVERLDDDNAESNFETGEDHFEYNNDLESIADDGDLHEE